MDRMGELLERTRQTISASGSGYLSIKTEDFLQLCDVIENAIPVLDRLQERLEAGCHIENQENRWILFDDDGESVCWGKNLREMLQELIFVDC